MFRFIAAAEGEAKVKAEVDRCLREDAHLGSRVLEVHPEVCFHAMAGGRSMASLKWKAVGREERAGLPSRHFPRWLDPARGDRRALDCEANDIFDGFAAVWTAARIVRGEAIRLPASPDRELEGFLMHILA